MTNVETFLDECRRNPGASLRVLFIVPTASVRDDVMKYMFNEAGARGLMPIWRHANTSMILDQSVAMFRIAHRHLHHELRGLDWHGISGLGYLERFDNCDEIVGLLGSRIRKIPHPCASE